ncbi:hypothetical protein QE152_g9548 [Popillia japonica]|uniref:Uncharacterized protein n=1 Tax=Popillia japonica TaxID=7064 RepID=A0AAW1LWH0_POPJA
MPGSCRNNPKHFCYVCGKFSPLGKSEKLSLNICRAYELYFDMTVKNQDKQWVPHVTCTTGSRYLRDWLCGQRQSLPFAISMCWKEHKNHFEDCCFCLKKTAGLNTRKKRKCNYVETQSAQKPRPHDEQHPVPRPLICQE